MNEEKKNSKKQNAEVNPVDAMFANVDPKYKNRQVGSISAKKGQIVTFLWSDNNDFAKTLRTIGANKYDAWKSAEGPEFSFGAIARNGNGLNLTGTFIERQKQFAQRIYDAGENGYKVQVDDVFARPSSVGDGNTIQTTFKLLNEE